ncbi:MAG: TIM44-like domain-containing protein, partial [Nannocystaceae bacterium]
PLTIGFAIFAYHEKQKKEKRAWDSLDTLHEDDVFIPPAMTVANISSLRKLDPEFSQVLFEDFIYRLYAAAHQARSSDETLARLAPYLSSRARNYLKKRPPAGVPVSNVVIGSMKIIEVQVPDVKIAQDGTPNGVRVVIKFESNLTAGPPNDPHTYYMRERWVLIRDATVQTQAPDGVHSLHCPSCGAPYQSSDQKRCDHCHQAVEGGHFDWSVSAISLLEQQRRPPSLTANVIETGNDKATVFQPGYERKFAKLTASDPEVTADALKARLELIYTELNQAWTALDLRGARPFVSDALCNYLQYWIDAYKNQGLKNVLENMRITKSEIVKTVRDRHFDAVTLRVYATGLDYTIRTSDNKRLSGSAKRNRAYTEYWTLIRAAKTRGAPRTDPNCPNCGAPLNIEMAGTCTYCNAHLTSGEFDWVLSRIEQDDSYNG